jgi:protein-S-isoprenylcysteine O-methyltransferase Ste14
LNAWPTWLVVSMWVVWFAFWRLASPGSTAAEDRESPWSRASYLLPMLLVIVLMIGPGWPPWLELQWVPGGWIRYWIGVGVLASGLGLTVWARPVLGRNWSGRIAIKDGQQLVRTGPYRWIRHPIYTGGLIAILGSAVASGRVCGFLAVALACAALGYKIRIEERWLMREFGDQYAEYRRSSWMLVPYVL